MNILHIIPHEKFVEPFILFINSNFKQKEHYFIIEKYTDTPFKNIKAENVTLVEKYDYWKLIMKAYKSDKIILHSLMSPRMMFFLLLQPWLLNKSYWVIWGADLYYYTQVKQNIKSKIIELIRKTIISKLKGFITHIKGDYELAKEWYNAKGHCYYSFLYPSNLYKDYLLIDKVKSSSRVYLQIGNSADPSNNHIEVLDKLKRYKDMDIELICPLSYGDKLYAEKVIKYGKEIFGDKFINISEFLPIDQYLDTLANIDIAIFNHKRQQAMGNIITLLGLGKKVYIREEITTWQFCKDHDLKVYSVNDGIDNLFIEMDEEIKQKNIQNVKVKFSKEKLKEDWKRIFFKG